MLMQLQHPQTEQSEEAREGDAVHEWAEMLVTAAMQAGLLPDPVPKAAKNGVVFTDSIRECAQVYADDVAGVMRPTGGFGGPNLGVEMPILAPRIHEQSHGRPDCFLYDRKTGNLYIWELKSGYRAIEVFENQPLINYASGILDYLEIDGIEEQNVTVHFRIVQPRAHHALSTIREWTILASGLRGYFNQLADKASEALGPDAVTRSGPHCLGCSAIHACPVALESGMSLWEQSGKPAPVELGPADLGFQLSIVTRARKQLEYLEEGYKAQVLSLLKGGGVVPRWNLESGRGGTYWSKPEAEVVALGKLCGVDLVTGTKTPLQAIAMGLDKALVESYSSKKSGALRIKESSGSHLRHVFGAVE